MRHAWYLALVSWMTLVPALGQFTPDSRVDYFFAIDEDRFHFDVEVIFPTAGEFHQVFNMSPNSTNGLRWISGGAAMRAANVLAEVEIRVSSNAIFDDHDAPNPDTLVLAFPLGSVIDAGMAMPQPISTKAGFTED